MLREGGREGGRGREGKRERERKRAVGRKEEWEDGRARAGGEEKLSEGLVGER